MEVLECRFRIGRAVTEALVAGMLTWFPGVGIALAIDERLAQTPWLPVPGCVLTTLVLTFLFWRRWRSRFRVDDQGVEFRRSRNRLETRLDWRHIEELFLLDETEFEVRGVGRQIRLAGPYENLNAARDICIPRLQEIRQTLQQRALSDGTVSFQLPGGRWKAHLAYFAAVLILTGLTWYCLTTLLDRRIRGFPFWILIFGGSWLWGLRRWASGLGTWVTLQREGIVVHRLDGKDKIPWEDLERTEWNDRGGINLLVRSRRAISLPATLANIALLEEFLQEGRRAVDSEAREGAEGRRMMQSP